MSVTGVCVCVHVLTRVCERMLEEGGQEISLRLRVGGVGWRRDGAGGVRVTRSPPG